MLSVQSTWVEEDRDQLVRLADVLALLPPASPQDEEYVPHPFNSRTPYESGDDRDIWCSDCDYHRDHQIHLSVLTPASPAEVK